MSRKRLIGEALPILASSPTSFPRSGFIHGAKPTSVDAGVYGFIANIHFYDIDTPLKRFVSAHPNLARHCETLHDVVMRPPDGETRR